MTGAFVGKNYRIAGRIVLSMEESGETYYWNEFHLIGDDGKCATLVFEQTENGPRVENVHARRTAASDDGRASRH